ncbi:MAG: hypothetical protein JW846_05465 [Dehalococcoidia bacterium]|nr:hypothetical protein [Dehalococcoidia bacterium]
MVPRSVFRTSKTVVAGCTAAFVAMLLVGCAPSNTPPEIIGLSCRQMVIAPLDSCLIECVAEDADGDELQYDWSSDSGMINGYEGTVAWTAPDDEGIYHVTVSVTDGGEEPAVSDTVTVIVKDNHYPSIDGLGAEFDWVRFGEPCTIACQASDIDGDSLNYVWSADCGEVTGEGDTVTWISPEFEGNCTVRVVVSDGYGGERTASVAVRVAENEPLVVTDMIVTPLDEPQYLTFYDERFKILKGKSCTIQAVSNAPERIVSYEWSDGGPVCVFPVGCEGFVFGSGPDEIQWRAPLERGEYTIMVTVRDDQGHFAEKSIVMKVETCTCAFPKEEPAEGEEAS